MNRQLVIIVSAQLIAQVVISGFLVHYFGRKAENLAEKQDVAEITRQVESVKAELQLRLSRQEETLQLHKEFCDTFHQCRLTLDELAAKYGGPDNIASHATPEELKRVNTYLEELNTLLARLFLVLPDDDWRRVQSAIPLEKLSYNDFMYACIDALRRNAYPDTKLNAKDDIRRFYDLKPDIMPPKK